MLCVLIRRFSPAVSDALCCFFFSSRSRNNAKRVYILHARCKSVQRENPRMCLAVFLYIFLCSVRTCCAVCVYISWLLYVLAIVTLKIESRGAEPDNEESNYLSALTI